MRIHGLSVILLLATSVAACGEGSSDGTNGAAGASGSTAGSAGTGTGGQLQEAGSGGASSGGASGLDAGGSGTGGASQDASVQSCVASPKMSFFFTREGSGAKGGNLGGLVGADATCQAAATAAGQGARTWRAYLSALNDATYGRVDARDRIGTGPWFNFDGDSIGTHGQIHHESGNGIPAKLQKSACGFQVDAENPNATLFNHAHDIFTGSDEFGRLIGGTGPDDPPLTCADWTSSSPSDIAYVGHEDTDFSAGFWNSAHTTVGCDEQSLGDTLAIGRIYCFAID